MIKNTRLSEETYARIDELIRIGSEAVAKAQAESRRLGVPNVYAYNGRIYYETSTVTARDMTDNEKRRYKSKKNR